MADENLRLRAALRDLVALSTIPAWWIGIEPRMIAVGLADILVGSLGFDFAFVRLLDPTGGEAIDVTSGCATTSQCTMSAPGIVSRVTPVHTALRNCTRD
jgi:hypothetical protein